MSTLLEGIGLGERRRTRTYDSAQLENLVGYLRDHLVPVGSIVAKVTTTAPSDSWKICNGQALAKATFPDLYADIGGAFGEMATHFNLPNLTDRYLAGTGTVAAGGTMGANDLTLTVGQLPAHGHTFTPTPHSHGITDPGHIHSEEGTGAGTGLGAGTDNGVAATTGSSTTGISVDDASAGGTVENTGSGDAIDKRPASMAVYWFIKATE